MKIQLAKTPVDFEVLEKLAAEIWHQHYTPIIGPEQVRYMLARYQSVSAMQQQVAEGYEYYLASKKEIPVGYFSFREDREELFLSKIYLRKNWRRQGLGSLMLNYMVETARKRDLKNIRLTVNKSNSASIDAYERMGFEKIRPVVIDIGHGFIMDDFEMLKTL